MQIAGKLDGKVAVVTGGGRGLGRATALAFAAEGASLAIVSRTESELSEVVRLIGDKRCLAIAGDVGQRETARRVVAATLDKFGGIDILMNNAAVVGPLKHMEDISEQEWEASLDVNLKGAFLFAAEVVPHMRRRGGGAIINVTSGLGSFVLSPFGLYCIAKAGLNQLTGILALELKEAGIRVNGLNPGVMDTSMQEKIRAAGPQALGSDTWQRFVAYKESGMLETPEQVARLAVFLAAAPPTLSGETGDAAHFRSFGFAG